MATRERGSSLPEVLVALFLLAVGLLAVAPMFVSSAQGNAAGADLGEVGAHAVARMEQLRGTAFSALTAGGSLTSDVAGYFDASDPAYRVRWEIVDAAAPPGIKEIRVRAQAVRQVVGQPKSVDLVTLRGR